MAAFTARDLRDLPPAEPVARELTDAELDRQREQEGARRTALAETLAGQTPAKAYSPIVLSGVVRIVECLLLAASGFLVFHFYVQRPMGMGDILALAGVVALAMVVFQALNLNRVGVFRAPVYQGFRILGGWTLVFLVALGAVFFLKLDGAFSRVWLMAWWAVGLALLILGRLVLSVVVRALTASGQLERRTVIVGGGPAGEQLLRELAAQKHSDLRICGVFDDRTDERAPDVVAGFPKLGAVEDLVEFARSTRIDLVIFALPITAEQRLLHMLRKLWVLPIDIRLAAHANKLRFRPRSYSWIGSVPVLDVFDKPIADWDVVLKWAFDKIVGTIALVLLSPVMLAVALAIRLDSRGPVLFRQKRYGFNNELIEVFKFRSMYVDRLDETASRLVTRGDPRVTRVGRVIRKTSLDELPQLFNVVFKGNLSLVGPRPHAVHAKAADHLYDDVVDGYFARHRVRPGLTGWAQIHGWRGETDTEEKIQRRVEHDLFYIENWSLMLDVYILAMTPLALLKAENAY